MPASTPQEIHFLFERAFNIGDVEAILALYEPGAVLVAGGKPVTGHDGIRDALNVFLSSGARMKLDTGPLSNPAKDWRCCMAHGRSAH
jgi:hypothetical protein